jgi:hypothetical protein
MNSVEFKTLLSSGVNLLPDRILTNALPASQRLIRRVVAHQDDGEIFFRGCLRVPLWGEHPIASEQASALTIPQGEPQNHATFDD